MPRRAIRDTYAVEDVYGVPVRRLVKAGAVVPARWDVDDADVEDPDKPKQAPKRAKSKKDADVSPD